MEKIFFFIKYRNSYFLNNISSIKQIYVNAPYIKLKFFFGIFYDKSTFVELSGLSHVANIVSITSMYRYTNEDK